MGFKCKLVLAKLFARCFEKTKFKTKCRSNLFVYITKDGKKFYNKKIKGLNIDFHGSGNYVEIKEPRLIGRLNVYFMGNNSVLKIDEGCIFRRDKIHLGTNCQVLIADRVTTQSIWISALGENISVKIGSSCMFSHNINFRASDGHVIYNEKTKEVLNFPKSILIGNHVWLGMNTMILKGAVIPDNCMVGACSIVNKQFEQTNCILAGQPARVIREGINWDRTAPDVFARKMEMANEF